MSALVESLLILLSISFSYIWLENPELRPYSLQLTSLFFVIYFLAKRIQRVGWHHVLPSTKTFEAALLTTAIALVVGATGGLSSPFLPLFHLLLFISALSLGVWANLVEMSALTVFLWAISSHPFTNENLISLLSLPFLLPLMIFARLQFEEAQIEKNKIKKNKNYEQKINKYLEQFLLPKLRSINQSLNLSSGNIPLAQKQIALVENETTRIIQEAEAEDHEEELA